MLVIAWVIMGRIHPHFSIISRPLSTYITNCQSLLIANLKLFTWFGLTSQMADGKTENIQTWKKKTSQSRQMLTSSSDRGKWKNNSISEPMCYKPFSEQGWGEQSENMVIICF